MNAQYELLRKILKEDDIKSLNDKLTQEIEKLNDLNFNNYSMEMIEEQRLIVSSLNYELGEKLQDRMEYLKSDEDYIDNIIKENEIIDREIYMQHNDRFYEKFTDNRYHIDEMGNRYTLDEDDYNEFLTQ